MNELMNDCVLVPFQRDGCDYWRRYVWGGPVIQDMCSIPPFGSVFSYWFYTFLVFCPCCKYPKYFSCCLSPALDLHIFFHYKSPVFGEVHVVAFIWLMIDAFVIIEVHPWSESYIYIYIYTEMWIYRPQLKICVAYGDLLLLLPSLCPALRFREWATPRVCSQSWRRRQEMRSWLRAGHSVITTALARPEQVQ